MSYSLGFNFQYCCDQVRNPKTNSEFREKNLFFLQKFNKKLNKYSKYNLYSKYKYSKYNLYNILEHKIMILLKNSDLKNVEV